MFVSSTRLDHCSAGISSTNQTFEIFIYGGYNNNRLGPQSTQYDDIHILTLPAFHWIRVPYKAQYPRMGHTCTPIGGSQILVLGGSDASVDNSTAHDPKDQGRDVYWKQLQNAMATPDQRKLGIGIFELSTLAWREGFDAEAREYTQSDDVQQYYQQAGR